MRKKAALLLLCMMCALCGCGKEEKASQGTEASTSLKSTDIEYNVDDYVELGDYTDVEITLNEKDYEITDEVVNEYAQQILAYNGVYTADKDKTVVGENDIVDVDYVGKKDGAAFEGGSAQNQILDVANNMDAVEKMGFIDGFTAGLVGAKVGETVDCNVTFPENYGNKDLAGEEVTFTFTVNAVEKVMPLEELDDETVKTSLKMDSKEAFMREAESRLKSQMEYMKQSDIRLAVIDLVTEKSQVKEFPEGLLETRVEEYISQYEKQNCQNGVTLEDFIKSRGEYDSVDAFREEVTSNMKDNLKQEMVFEAVAKKEDIAFDEEGYQSFISNLLASKNLASEDALYEMFGPDKESGKLYMQKLYVQEKACEMVVEKTKVNYEEKENS